MVTRIRINYVEREADHKIPRPHFVNLLDNNTVSVEAGEIGPLRALLGFCPTGPTPDIDDWQMFKPSEVVALPGLAAGTYPQFIDADGTPFGYDWQVESVELQ